MVVLRWQGVPLSNADLITTSGTTIDTSIGGSCSRRRKRVVCLVVGFSQVLTMFVLSQDGLLSG